MVISHRHGCVLDRWVGRRVEPSSRCSASYYWMSGISLGATVVRRQERASKRLPGGGWVGSREKMVM